MADTTITRPSCQAVDLTKDLDVAKDGGVRLYDSSPGCTTLQIRSYGSTAQRRGGAPKMIVSSAEINIHSARALRKLLDRFISEQKGK